MTGARAFRQPSTPSSTHSKLEKEKDPIWNPFAARLKLKLNKSSLN
uniref:Uncharacterized protein n=1 Tax=Anguilla anguilla TaxID=7936 RepID=A0A0E9PWY2_ANGAN